MKKVLVLVIGLFFLVGCSGVHQKTATDQWSRIEKNKKVIIGLDDTFVPMGFQEKSGNLVGFDVDLARAVFEPLGITVDFQAIDWDMKEQELNNQTIDLIWNGYTKNSEREALVRFSDTYMKNEQILVTLKSSGITSFQAMTDKTVGMQTNSAGYDVFNAQPNILKQYVKDADDPVLYDGFNEAIIDLNAKRIDGLLIDRVYANYYLEQAGEFDQYNLINGGFDSEDFAVGARKSDAQLVAVINQQFKRLVQSGEFERISIKWFGENVAPEDLLK
ncbi:MULTISPECIES: amino acid ABC transporter substrate-binding protein [unclassified Enterococcus]|uniref:amino acid ABC transporter substrate-binding protein n=1 Tax=unclassified Enterococcus TaxID=2608891 RepID=UPI001552A69B|nr:MULTISPECIES: amino acid ABC transporter substrate-binding protein [unclassified Enterococcus]MBS7576006.1 amino acid ABC transporter substrate-binding protein [Enterococcus sp. MMGLQ5-2]MBS7583239.1 amino acid ABC transporter substrate-binding protein [Enterococcus sp. MMGLQ5-1]NPD11099.1 amino acid ABC transporter substrate-binding protein [Enterococcus sp. MMGLQ5-1]NPD35842.1 amino acid ABC transporter substrate-binding protein [Enterococcus sp. MMGLQ5-2]